MVCIIKPSSTGWGEDATNVVTLQSCWDLHRCTWLVLPAGAKEGSLYRVPGSEGGGWFVTPFFPALLGLGEAPHCQDSCAKRVAPGGTDGDLLSLELWSFLYWDLPTGVVGFCFQAEKGVQPNFPAHLKKSEFFHLLPRLCQAAF